MPFSSSVVLSFLSVPIIWLQLIPFSHSSCPQKSDELSGYCSSKFLSGSEISDIASKLSHCRVIEGHLSLHRGILPDKTSLPNLIQVRDYVMVERVEGLVDLSILFPRLAVIRGMNLLFNKYALILHGNLDLEVIGNWSMKSIVHGSVRVEDNILLCTEDEVHFKKFVSPNFQDGNFYDNNMQFCPFVGCEEKGYCKAREKTCKTLGLPCPSVQEHLCDTECAGGCFKEKDPKKCVACKNFQMPNRSCVPECPSSHLNYLDYRCISYETCNCRNWTVLNPEDTRFLTEGNSAEDIPPNLLSYHTNKDHIKCIKDCPDEFIQDTGPHPGGSSSIRTCKLRPVCKTTTLTNRNLGDNLKYCNHIDGNLIILVAGGKNVTQRLEENLLGIETVSGYVKIAGANALLSLSFLSNLKSIQGKETIYGGESHEGYSLYIIENSNLRQLWDWNFRSQKLEIKSSVYVHFNDRLCDSEISRLKQFANISHGKINNGSNGKNAPCNIFETYLKAIPGTRNGTVHLSWMHMYCGVNPGQIMGYQIFYRSTEKNVSIYHGRDVCNDPLLWPRDTAELKAYDKSQCITYTLKCLAPNTRYAIYVESLSVNNIRHSIRSNIVYVTTYNDIPKQPYIDHFKLRDDGISLSWELPKLQSYFSKEEIFYEIFVFVEEDRSVKDDENSDKHFKEEDEEDNEESKTSKTENFCPCSKYSENTYLLQEQKRKSMEIADEISRLRYNRREENPHHSSRAKRDTSTTDEKETCGVLKSERLKIDRKFDKKTCNKSQASVNDCKDPINDWSSTPNKFKKVIEESTPWETKNIAKRERTQEKNIFVKLPTDYAVEFKPRKISVKIRSCVGETNPCPMPNIDGSCAICSKFMTSKTPTVDTKTVPDFNVKPWRKTESNEKTNLNYIHCNTFSSDRSTNFVDKTLDDILDASSKEENIPRDLNVSVLNITWTEPSNFADFIVGYRILYHRIDVSDKQTTIIFLNKTEAEKRNYLIEIPVDSAVKAYWVGFEIKYIGGDGPANEKCISIPWNQTTDIYIYFACAVVVGLGILTAVAIYKTSREMYITKKLEMLLKGTPSITYYGTRDYLDGIDAKFRLKPKELRLIKEMNPQGKTEIVSIGKGEFGKVFKGVITKDGIETEVAVKAIIGDNSGILEGNSNPEGPNHLGVAESSTISKDELIQREEEMDALKKEAIIMQTFDSNFLVKMLGILFIPHAKNNLPSLYIALERLDMDFETYFMKNGEELSEKHMIEILIQCGDGLAYMHEKNHIHKDLACRNILFAKRNSDCDWSPSFAIKIGDFGLSSNFSEHYHYFKNKNTRSNEKIPCRSIAPEYFSDQTLSSKSDVWAFGVLIYELVMRGEKPYKEFKNEDVINMVPEGKLNLSFEETRSKVLLSMMNKCLILNAICRPSAENIVRELINETTPEFIKWFVPLSTTYSHATNSQHMESESLEAIDEGFFPSSSLDASQDSSSTPRTFQKDENIINETDDDVACLTPKECSRNRVSSCLAFETLSCRKKNVSTSDDEDPSFQ